MANAALETRFCAHQLLIDAGRPCTVLAVEQTIILALDRDANKYVVFFHDSDNDGLPDSRQNASGSFTPNLNHGLALNNGYIYASSDTTVYRWSYNIEELNSIGEQEGVFAFRLCLVATLILGPASI